MRVAVAQFATSSNYQENITRCINVIQDTSACTPELIVLPEYSNTCFSSCGEHNTQLFYVDHNQAWNEALPIDGVFLQTIAEQAIKHNCYILINVTVRRDLKRVHVDGDIKSNITVTSCLFSPLGQLIHQQDKRSLSQSECHFFKAGSDSYAVIDTPFGKLGILSGNDSLTYQASRELALGGAQLLCNSLSTFAIDQSRLLDPARACENNVYLVSSNKVGSLVPISNEEELQDDTTETIIGSGLSQIITPSGIFLAKAKETEEGFAFADVDLSEQINTKLRPDGTELIKQRRPELYQHTNESQYLSKNLNIDLNIKLNQKTSASDNNVPTTANVAIFATYKSDLEAINDVCHYIENNLSDIIQLPELFFISDKTITHNEEQRIQITHLSEHLISQVSAVLRPFQYLCTSVILDGQHQAIIINEQGLYATQSQLHFCQRYTWTTLGDNLNIVDLPLEQGSISVAMLTADDANIPEIVHDAAKKGIQLLLVPFDIQEPCEVQYSLLSRAAENRICIVAASREKTFKNDTTGLTANNDQNNIYRKNKVKTHKSTGLVINLTVDTALLPQWRIRKFNGYLNEPVVKEQYGKITKAVVHPIAACK